MRHVAVKFDSAKSFFWYTDRNANAGNISKFYGPDGEVAYQYDADHKDGCNGDTIPAHNIANMVAVLMGDYPVPYFRKDSVPEVKGHLPGERRSYMDIARDARVDITTFHKNYETIWTDKGNRRHPTAAKQRAVITIDGVDHEIRGIPSFTNLAELIGRSEWERMQEMFSHYLGKDFLTKYSATEILVKTHELYAAGDREAFDRYAEGPFLTLETTLITNSVLKIIGKGEVCGSAFRLDCASPRTSSYARATHGVEKNMNTACGTIHLKLDDDEYMRIMSHGQVATILDGGVATIDLGDSMDEWSDYYEMFTKPYENN